MHLSQSNHSIHMTLKISMGHAYPHRRFPAELKKSFVSCDFQEKKKKSNQFCKLSSLVKKRIRSKPADRDWKGEVRHIISVWPSVYAVVGHSQWQSQFIHTHIPVYYSIHGSLGFLQKPTIVWASTLQKPQSPMILFYHTLYCAHALRRDFPMVLLLY